MDAVNIWKFLHSSFMFVAVSIFVGQGICWWEPSRARETSGPSDSPE
jgi:hypothetical protein